MSNSDKVSITLAIIALLAIISIGFFTQSPSEKKSQEWNYKTYKAVFVDNPTITTNLIVFKTDTLSVGDTVIAEWNPEEEYNTVRFDLVEIPPTMNTRIYKVVITE